MLGLYCQKEGRPPSSMILPKGTSFFSGPVHHGIEDRLCRQTDKKTKNITFPCTSVVAEEYVGDWCVNVSACFKRSSYLTTDLLRH